MSNVSFGEESFDHIPTETMLKIVQSKKIYDLQDIIYNVWYANKKQNNNIRGHGFPFDKEVLQIWLNGAWRPRLIEEVIQRMIEISVSRIYERLQDTITEDEKTWLKSIPQLQGREYNLLYKGVKRFIFSF